MAVSLRLSEDIKKRVSRLATTQDKTAHAFMLEAIVEKVEAEEIRTKFHAEGKRRLARMRKSGVVIPAEEVFDYLSSRASGEAAVRPKARNIR